MKPVVVCYKTWIAEDLSQPERIAFLYSILLQIQCGHEISHWSKWPWSSILLIREVLFVYLYRRHWLSLARQFLLSFGSPGVCCPFAFESSCNAFSQTSGLKLSLLYSVFRSQSLLLIFPWTTDNRYLVLEEEEFVPSSRRLIFVQKRKTKKVNRWSFTNLVW